MPLAEAQRRIDAPGAFDRLVALGVIRVDGTQATMTRPKLIDAFNEIRGYGVSMDKLIELHEQIVPLVDQISEMLARARPPNTSPTGSSPAKASPPIPRSPS